MWSIVTLDPVGSGSGVLHYCMTERRMRSYIQLERKAHGPSSHNIDILRSDCETQIKIMELESGREQKLNGMCS